MAERTLTEISNQLSEMTQRLQEVERRLGIPAVCAGPVEAASSLVPVPDAREVVGQGVRGAPQNPLVEEPRVSTTKSEAFRGWAAARTAGVSESAPDRSQSGPLELEPVAAAPRRAPPTAPPRVPVARPATVAHRSDAGSESAARRENEKSIAAAGLQSLERMIGGRWYAVVGAVIVVIGVGLFFKVALQRGWIVFPPAIRCAGGAVFGLALLGAGEWARRKISDWAAVGLLAAGLGVLYTAVYAAYGVFHLVGHGAAFAMLVGVALMGVGIGARGRLISISLVSMIGGYLTPAIFHDVTPTPGVLPAYLLTLLAVGLVLAAWRGGGFRAVRALAWWGTILEGGAWVLGRGSVEPVLATLFLILVWAGVHFGMTLEAVRHGFGASGVGTRGAEDEPSDDDEIVPPKAPPNWRTLACSFSTTSWTAVLGIIVVRQWAVFPDWLVPGAIGAASLWLSFFLAGNLRVLRDVPRTDAQRLGACLAAQAGALLVATVAIGITGSAQVLTWAAMGLAAVVAARWLRSRGLDVYGLIVLSLAALRVVVYERLMGTLLASPSVIMGVYLTEWSVMTAGVGLAWGGAAWMLRKPAPEKASWRAVANAAAAVSATLILGSLFDLRMSAIAGVVLLVTAAIALVSLGRGLRSPGVAIYGGFMLVVASLYPAARNWTEPWAPGGGLAGLGLRLTAWSAAMAYGGAAWMALGVLAQRSAIEGVRRFGALGCAAGITLIMGSLLHGGMRAEAGVVVGVIAAVLVFAAAAVMRSTSLLVYFGILLAGVTLFAPTRVWWQADASGPSIEFLGLRLTAWTGVIAFAGSTWIALTPLLKRFESREARALSIAGGGIGLGLLIASFMHVDAAPASLCAAWLFVLIAGSLLERLLRCSRLDLWAVAGLAVPTFGWVVWYPAWSGWPGAAAVPGLYEGFWVGLAIAVTAAGLPGLVLGEPGDKTANRVRAIGWAAFVVMLFGATSLEIGRSSEFAFSDAAMQRAAVSMWWGIFGFSMIALGFWLRRGGAVVRGIPVVRHVGLVLLFVATVKAVTFDLASVPPLGRALSFIGLGLLMLAVAVTYGKMSKRLGAGAAGPDTEQGREEPGAPIPDARD